MLKLAQAAVEEMIEGSSLYKSLLKKTDDLALGVDKISEALLSLASAINSHTTTLVRHEKMINQLATLVLGSGEKERGLSLELPDSKGVKEGSDKPN